jgi:hypothetical protein
MEKEIVDMFSNSKWANLSENKNDWTSEIPIK